MSRVKQKSTRGKFKKTARYREHPDICRIIGLHLRELRQSVGLLQEDLAILAEIDRTYPSLLEKGKRAPTVPMFIRYVRQLRRDPAKELAAIICKLDKQGLVKERPATALRNLESDRLSLPGTPP